MDSKKNVLSAKHPTPPKGAKVFFREGVQLIQLDDDASDGKIPTTHAETIEELGDTLGDFVLGVEYIKDKDGNLIPSKPFKVSGVKNILKRFRKLDGLEVTEKSGAHEGSAEDINTSTNVEKPIEESNKWAVHVVEGEGYSAFAEGSFKELSQNLLAGVFVIDDTIKDKIHPDVLVGFIPVKRPDEKNFIFGIIKTVLELEDNKISIILKREGAV